MESNFSNWSRTDKCERLWQDAEVVARLAAFVATIHIVRFLYTTVYLEQTLRSYVLACVTVDGKFNKILNKRYEKLAHTFSRVMFIQINGYGTFYYTMLTLVW